MSPSRSIINRRLNPILFSVQQSVMDYHYHHYLKVSKMNFSHRLFRLFTRCSWNRIKQYSTDFFSKLFPFLQILFPLPCQFSSIFSLKPRLNIWKSEVDFSITQILQGCICLFFVILFCLPVFLLAMNFLDLLSVEKH